MTERHHYSRPRPGRALLAAVLFGVLALISTGALPASAEHGEGAFATYQGFVMTEEGTALPTRIRATSAVGTVCGTATVEPHSPIHGWYELHVASGDQKAGCPQPGEVFTIRLLHGMLDDGTGGQQQLTLAPGVHTHHIFSGDSVTLSGFVGELPPPGGIALIRWEGPGGTPVEVALATIAAEIAAVFHFDSDEGRWRGWFAGAPSFAQSYLTVEAGHIVVIRRAGE